jgi:hypothetical protein
MKLVCSKEDDETMPTDYLEDQVSFSTNILPTWVLSAITYYELWLYLKQPIEKPDHAIWIYNLIIGIRNWFYLNIGEDVSLLVILCYPLVCSITICFVYTAYKGKWKNIEHRLSQILLLSAIEQKNRIIDGSLMISLNEMLQITSNKMVEFISHLGLYNNLIQEENNNHKAIIYEVDSRLLKMQEALSKFVSFSDDLSEKLNRNMKELFVAGKEEAEHKLQKIDKRIKDVKEMILILNSFTKKFTDHLCTSICDGFASGKEDIENQIQKISADVLTQSFNQVFNEAADVMIDTGKGLNKTSLLMRSISEEFNTTVKTYEWFNEIAINVASELKSASNEFCVAVKPFNQLIDQVNEEMLRSSSYLRQFALSTMQEVTDAIGSKINGEIEYRSDWMNNFMNDITNRIEECFHEAISRIIYDNDLTSNLRSTEND